MIRANSKEEAEREVGQVVEGIRACKMARRLVQRYRIKAPLIELIYKIIEQRKNPQQEIELFLKKFKT
jgi:glycerol-3-phosphate dehydrogenase (NAD(P)+)